MSRTVTVNAEPKPVETDPAKIEVARDVNGDGLIHYQDGHTRAIRKVTPKDHIEMEVTETLVTRPLSLLKDFGIWKERLILKLQDVPSEVRSTNEFKFAETLLAKNNGTLDELKQVIETFLPLPNSGPMGSVLDYMDSNSLQSANAVLAYYAENPLPGEVKQTKRPVFVFANGTRIPIADMVGAAKETGLIG